MRILPLLLAAAVALPACAMTPGQKKAGVAVGVLTAIAGAAAIGYASTVPCEKDPDFATGVGCIAGSLELTAAGAVLVGVGLVALGVSAASPTLEEPRKAPVLEPLATLDSDNPAVQPRGAHYVAPSMVPPAAPGETAAIVRQLHDSARTSARNGSCRAVETIAERIAQLDPTYRRGAFASDPDIAACVD